MIKGKFIELFPGDTTKKYAKVIDENKGGILVKILQIENDINSNFKEGEVYFISYSIGNGLFFRILKSSEIEKLNI